MYETPPGTVIGFHSCDQKVGEALIAGKIRLKPSTNEYDWLGSGSYFWEGDLVRATEYARWLSRRKLPPKIENPFVVGAVIQLGRCLNLLQRSHLSLVGQSHRLLVEASLENGRALPVNSHAVEGGSFLFRDLDCAVLNYAHTIRAKLNKPPFDTIRAAFWEGEELYPTAGFRAQNHVQVCVRNPNCIKGYFRPLRKVASHRLPGADV
jgi:hypothetical protein